MTSSRRLIIVPTARRDIRSILRSSKDTWGDDQRIRYSNELTAAMERLRAYPELGRGETYLPGLRSHVVNRHVIYYVVDQTAVRVLRLLHVRMDAASQFLS